MKSFALVISFIDLFVGNVFNQTFQWANGFGANYYDYANGAAISSNGNLYSVGAFFGTVDFDPGIGVTNVSSNGGFDAYIAKFNLAGNFIWAKNLGGSSDDYGYSVAVDDSDNTYITGYFADTADFDPGTGTSNLISAGIFDVFVCKLDPSGDLVWVVRIGNTGNDFSVEMTIEANNIYVTGVYHNTVDFDPGVGTADITEHGGGDIFVVSLDTDGHFNWAKGLGGPGSDSVYGIDVDDDGNVYTTGSHSGGDFDPGIGIYNLSHAGGIDLFVSKLDPDGNFIWAKNFAGTSDEEGKGITVDNNGNVYATGYFSQTVDFDPGAATYNLTANALKDIFILKMDSLGHVEWARGIGGNAYDSGEAITTDAWGSVYVAGGYQSTVNFDPGTSTDSLASAGYSDAFVLKLDGAGHFTWVEAIGNTGADVCTTILLDNSGGIYTSGFFEFTCDFDPGIGVTNLSSHGIYDVFMLKLFDASSNAIEESVPYVFTVYPNPTPNIINVTGIDQPTVVSIYNVTGQKLTEWNLNVNNSQLNLEEFSHGIYFLNFQMKNQSVVCKILKQ